ncbi:MAG: hypothetical protein JXA16_01050 [Bacteroidales bacterium]|nr:hypothetical protein [Bacteroidales bacterium]
MSKTQEEILKRLKSISNNNIETEPATVKSVDEGKRTCVAIIDDYELEDVRLNAVVDNNENVSFILPVIGSWILVSYILGSETDAYVCAFSEVEKVIIKANNVEAELTEILLNNVENLVINNGENAGLVKVVELTEKLNNIESDINNLKQAIASWAPVAQDGGAGLKMGLNSWLGLQLTPTKQADLENGIIKH